MLLQKLKLIARFVLVFYVKIIRIVKGKKTKYPSDPHSHYKFSFEISRVIQSADLKSMREKVEFNERLDILPSNLYEYKEVIYVPPVLFESPTIYVNRFRNVQILGNSPIALTDSGDLIQENLFRTKDRNRPSLSYLSPLEIMAFLGIVNRKVKPQEGQYCLLASFWDNFGHWIPEHLLKIYSLIQAGIDISNVNFILRSLPTGFKIDLLEAAGISRSQIFFWNQSFLRVEELVVPSYPQITRDGLDWVNSLIPAKRAQPLDSYKKIYLSRQLQNHRKIINEVEVQQVLQRYGFISIHPEELSFKEQVDLVRNSNLLFGPQGSAFTLQIFMQQGSVLEAFPQNRIHLFNRQVSIAKGHKHHILLDPRGADSTKYADRNIVVDVHLLNDSLEKIIKSIEMR